MSTDVTRPRTRRALLATAAAAAAGTAVALARPAASLAADGGTLTLGADNTADTTTTLTKSGTSTGLHVVNDTGNAVTGSSADAFAVAGASTTSVGVYGSSTSAQGVRGISVSGAGVLGNTTGPTSAGVIGIVDGISDQLHRGVWGYADGTGGRAVEGETLTGVAVHGTSDTGTAVKAVAATVAATALDVRGRAAFSTAARVTIPKGRASIRLTRPYVNAASLVIATLQQKRTGLYVLAAVPGSGTLTIHLNKAAPADTRVAFFVLE